MAKKKIDKDMEYAQKNLKKMIRHEYISIKKVMKIEYYDKINWGTVLFDIAIIYLIGYTKNYWLIILLLISGGYSLPKYKLRRED